jgi:hypothetical protein
MEQFKETKSKIFGGHAPKDLFEARRAAWKNFGDGMLRFVTDHTGLRFIPTGQEVRRSPAGLDMRSAGPAGPA